MEYARHDRDIIMVVSRRHGVITDEMIETAEFLDDLERARFRRAAENGRRHGWPLVDEDGERI